MGRLGRCGLVRLALLDLCTHRELLLKGIQMIACCLVYSIVSYDLGSHAHADFWAFLTILQLTW